MERKIHEGKLKLALDSTPAPTELSQSPLSFTADNILTKDIIFVPDTQLPCAQPEPLSPGGDLDNSCEPDIYVPSLSIEPDTKRKKGGGNSLPTLSPSNQPRKKITRGKGKGKAGPKLIVDTLGKSHTNRTPARAILSKPVEGRKITHSFTPMAPSLEHIGNTLSAILDRLQHIEGRLDRLCSTVKSMETISLASHPHISPCKHIASSVSHHSLSGPAITNLNTVPCKVITNGLGVSGRPPVDEPAPAQVQHQLAPLKHHRQLAPPELITDSGVFNQGISDLGQGGGLSIRPRHLDLPPAAAPLVIVLANVPALMPLEKETSAARIRRVTRWMNCRLGLNNGVGYGLIMAERVSWLGYRPKTLPFMNDCIVLNFRARHLAERVLLGLNQYPEEARGIQALPLGYFYPPANPLTYDTHVADPPGWKTYVGPSRVSAGLPVRHLSYTSGASFNLINRFAPLTDLNSLD